jgi:outer membrane protein with beta-barrel domain
MRLISRGVSVATLLVLAVSSEAVAQHRTAVGVAFPQASSRLALPATAPALQKPAASTTAPTFSAFGGIATGDGPYDLGFALGGNALWSPATWPVDIRADLYIAHHGGSLGSALANFDTSVNIFGLLGHARYVFPVTGSSVHPYVLGGLGLFYSRFSFDDNFPGETDYGSTSSTDLGISLGGGADFTERFGAELRIMDFNSFTTIPITFVIHF